MPSRFSITLIAVLAIAIFTGNGGLYAQTTTHKTPSSRSTPAATGPSLKESLDFIRDTLAQYGKSGYAYLPGPGYVHSGITANLLESYSVIGDSDGCIVDLTNTYKLDPLQTGSPAITKGISTFHLRLSSLDPSSIVSKDDTKVEVADDPSTPGQPLFTHDTRGAHVSIDAMNNARVISASEDGKEQLISKVYMYLSSHDLADRVAKALNRAVILCGGKPSAF